MHTPALRTGSRTPVIAFGLAALLAASTAVAQGTGGTVNIQPSADTSSIYRRDTGIDDSGRYRQEVQACRSGRSPQARETCLQEARNALAAKRRGQLSKQDENFMANAMARCQPLAGEFRAACAARVMGFGSASGSVAGGGLLREVETVVLPAGATSIRIEPQTQNPVVLVPSTASTGQTLAAGGAAGQRTAGQQEPQRTLSVIAVKPVDTESMEKLREAAQRLREAIQAMAQKKPGPERDRAIGQAHEALLETQRAMVVLPPELRSSGTMSADYDESVTKLMKAADSLRESIQAMAQQPAGDGRDRAIEQARQALWDSQQAMLGAYSAGASDARSMGAAGQSAGSGAATPAGKQ